MVLTRVELVIIKGIYDASQKTYYKGLDNIDHSEVIEDSMLQKNKTWQLRHEESIFMCEPVASSLRTLDIL